MCFAAGEPEDVSGAADEEPDGLAEGAEDRSGIMPRGVRVAARRRMNALPSFANTQGNRSFISSLTGSILEACKSPTDSSSGSGGDAGDPARGATADADASQPERRTGVTPASRVNST